MRFQTAVKYWRRINTVDDVPNENWKRYNKAEEVILDHQPEGPEDIVAMLDVLSDGDGVRGDCLDTKALCAIRRFICTHFIDSTEGLGNGRA